MRQFLSGRGRRSGFTLIDVLVVAVLLAVAILFITTIFAVGYSNVDAGGGQTEAAIRAQDILEWKKTVESRIHGGVGTVKVT